MVYRGVLNNHTGKEFSPGAPGRAPYILTAWQPALVSAMVSAASAASADSADSAERTRQIGTSAALGSHSAARQPYSAALGSCGTAVFVQATKQGLVEFGCEA